ncbi:esterase [Enterococcus silesiacus]|uniref:Esterase n=1 Tax=Enterococcus silesiacus TaxID=332949 RepID=A0A0S3K8B8_9ENTE|nr:alpha/beta hydrolase family protein [Enterococcus silesiacus]ALS00499.1 esterase [Enterococcus silesiacus]OJG91263.1 tributyrin esterase [Enterococcus silesiacus]
MTIARMNFRSHSLDKATSITIYLPENMTRHSPVIYLLHGYSDDCNTWLDRTSLARFAEDYPFVIIMPQVELSYYTDMVSGSDYWEYLTQELPKKIHEWFGLASPANNTFVAGISMGGYGAFKWGMSFPEQVRAVASLSGALDVLSLWKRDASRNKVFGLAFGNKVRLSKSSDNLFQLFSTQLGEASAPYFLQICGTEDFLYQDNQTFRSKAAQTLAHYSYEEHAGGHTWDFWNQVIQRVLAYFSALNQA